ncbi:DUF4190 domain-containing protein [Cellulomonas sp. PS-H5]|uniref:DUF4190 domain-containing protein n=1 Tax=Cellulomonas sp. PS-H5 TaxID=2820400 RepID=UPI001C4FF067|nr:DUF4190 domain-containing protein [Cellulomonas sp. PS-H5]MBW0253483.1 DUF4190 domain-containing protein [Cellulomonas sp. PS-H5]
MSTPQPYRPTPQPYPQVVTRPTNALAVVTLVLGLLGFAVVPVVTGHVALRQIRTRGEGGTACAVIGLVLGYLALATYVVVALVVTGFLVWGGTR